MLHAAVRLAAVTALDVFAERHALWHEAAPQHFASPEGTPEARRSAA